MNVSPRIGLVVSAGKATLAELSTVLGLEDMYDLIEIIKVDAHNQRILNSRKQNED